MSNKVALWSNAPWAATGYGMQTAQLAKRLKADGYDVGIIANYGLAGAPMETEHGQIFPTGAHPYSLDVANDYADLFFEGERGTVIVLYDAWPLLEKPDLFENHDAWYWAPIDHQPAPPQVAEWCRTHNVIAMCDWGAEQMTAAGAPPAYTIPHAIELDTFKPTPSDTRERLDVPEDAHLTTIVMANIGQAPVRKSWFENLMAWRIFAEEHEDAYLYLHTQLQHPRGVNLAAFIKTWGLPTDRVRIVDQAAYMSGLVTPQHLAAIYTASDVTLMATAGEGFGIPAIESQACGTPVIGTAFSAQREVIEAGWKVSFATIWDYMQASAQALPDIAQIADALHSSYVVSKDETEREKMAQQAVAHAAKYDADTVYAEQWRPFLTDRNPVKLNRQQRRAQQRGKVA